jgi:dTDP-4-amino-4,6-dideoxygalactose transaminase
MNIEYENLKKLNKPFIKEYSEKFKSVIDSGWFILGNEVETFETDFSKFIGSKYCVGLANGLDALTLSLKAFNFKKGSEVLVPSNTYIATILAIINNGLIPVLVEPDLSTYNIDPNCIEDKITKKTCAIIVVHLYGKSCEMESIIELSKIYNLKLIEDCAQSHGSKYKGTTTGTFGDFGAFSFYPTKNLGALGDAGAITTNDFDLFKKIQSLRNYGSSVKYYNDFIGVNSRLDEMQAGFLNVKLKYLNKITEHKRKLAQIYIDNLNNNFIKPVQDLLFYDVFHIFNVRHIDRDQLRNYLKIHGIKTEIHYPVSPNNQKCFKNYFKENYPISELIHNTTLSLPISYFHTIEDVLFITDIMNKF